MFGPMLNTDPVQNTTRKKVGGDNGPGGGREMREREREKKTTQEATHKVPPRRCILFVFFFFSEPFDADFFVCLFSFCVIRPDSYCVSLRAGGGGTESGEAEKGAALRRDVIGGWGSSLTSRRGPDQSAVGWRRGLRARPHARSRTRTHTHTHTHM